ncbi:hypothetical protein FHS51_001382 [Sphingobium wenxiniae]|uniref:Fe-S-cluster containining protein n=1 Tax=Sphingobium wenxiniae (strain DSM 21828 / CGMCC 1.7748 / JZ-1) TaxID=595605 RepID=A0A562KKV1_SPHWJ|nr:hypothetical protein [Sphingobium wenxiniae]MBB6191160.1 hypothetical protein [Sphingobium wenxiniae]TWH96040.1 hypothetical protein IQ35_01129 [Sphingobium wenxiniae]
MMSLPPSCGSCTLCCTVMKVTMPSSVKPAHTACEHCTLAGCSIYADRPDVCAEFQCLWLATQQAPQFAMPSSFRPDRCGVLIDLNAAGTVLAHCAFPSSWKRQPIHGWLLGMAQRGHNVLLHSAHADLLLKADGSTQPLRCIGVDPVTKNRVYVPEAAA